MESTEPQAATPDVDGAYRRQIERMIGEDWAVQHYDKLMGYGVEAKEAYHRVCALWITD